MVPRLKEKYINEVVPRLKEEFKYSSVMAVPRIEKIVLNMGVGQATQNKNLLTSAINDLTTIAGQKAVKTVAKKSISNFKLRKGMEIGCKVTLRRDMMYFFLDKLINVALPRVRDFKGIPKNAFDGRGNYSFGIKEQIIFPEIDYDKVDAIRGLNVTIVTTAKTDEEARKLLEYLGMPFKK